MLRHTRRSLVVALHHRATFAALGTYKGKSFDAATLDQASRSLNPIEELSQLAPHRRVVERLQGYVKKESARKAVWMSDDQAGIVANVGIASAVSWLRVYTTELAAGRSRYPCTVTTSESLNMAVSEARKVCALVASRCDSSMAGPRVGLAFIRLAAFDADVDAAEAALNQIDATHLSRAHFDAAMAVANQNVTSPDWSAPAGYNFAASQFARMARLGLAATFSTVAHLANSVTSDSQLDEVVELLAHLMRQDRGTLNRDSATAVTAVLAAVARTTLAEGACERAEFCMQQIGVRRVPESLALEFRAAFVPAAARSGRPDKLMTALRNADSITLPRLSDPYLGSAIVAGFANTTDDVLACSQTYLYWLRRNVHTSPSLLNCLLIAQSIAMRRAPEMAQVSVQTFNATLKKAAARDSATYAIVLNNVARDALSAPSVTPSSISDALRDMLLLLSRLDQDELTIHPDAVMVIMQFLAKTGGVSLADEEAAAARRTLGERLDALSKYYVAMIVMNGSFMSRDAAATVTRVTSVPVNVDLAALGGMVASAERTVLDFHSVLSYFAWPSSSPRRASIKSFLRRGGAVLSPSMTVQLINQPSVSRVMLAEAKTPLSRNDVAPRYIFESATDRFRLRVVPDLLRDSSFTSLDDTSKQALSIWTG